MVALAARWWTVRAGQCTVAGGGLNVHSKAYIIGVHPKRLAKFRSPRGIRGATSFTMSRPHLGQGGQGELVGQWGGWGGWNGLKRVRWVGLVWRQGGKAAARWGGEVVGLRGSVIAR